MTGTLRDLCGAGEHAMSGGNVGVQRSTGRQFCRACRNDRRRRARQKKAEKRAAEPTCRKGHPFAGDNLHVTAKGEQTCRTCLDLANERRRERRWRASQATKIAETTPEAKTGQPGFAVPPGGVASMGVLGSRMVRGEAAARHRLALMIRQSRR